MRIISDFHDYYDCGQRLDSDRQLLYLRNSYEEDNTWSFPVAYCHYCDFPFSLHVLGFCGKLYPLFCFSCFSCFSSSAGFAPDVYCYNLSEIDNFYTKGCKAGAVKDYFNIKEHRCSRFRITPRYVFKKFFTEWDLHVAEYELKYRKVFEEKRCPIFIINEKGSTILYNPPISIYGFVRIFDPIKAYQEINMFMSNLAVPIKPIPTVSDVDMANIKGFNKYSFRKDPIKKRNKS